MSTSTSDTHALSESPFTFGVVPYMNAVPLLFRLSQVAPNATMQKHPPSLLAGLLLNGSLDAALVPVADVISNPGLKILTNIGVAARGAVKSVLIISRVKFDEIRTIRLDPESSTSNCLAQVIVQRHFHRKVEFWDTTSHPTVTADAEVVIGDKALQHSGSGLWQCDLAEAWFAMTGLPFVFAVWATRQDHPRSSDLAAVAEESLRRSSQTEIAFIARQQALRLRLPSALCLEYLTKIIHYSLDDQDQKAINTFQTYSADILTPSGAIA